MPHDDFIVTHERMRPTSFRQLAQWYWRKYQRGPLPSYDNAVGTLAAYVNHGRWIAECPYGCRTAYVVSDNEPYFMCWICANEDNDGKWLKVTFPKNRAAVETELLKRPARNPKFDARTRNWKPGEAVKDLKRENSERGIR